MFVYMYSTVWTGGGYHSERTLIEGVKTNETWLALVARFPVGFPNLVEVSNEYRTCVVETVGTQNCFGFHSPPRHEMYRSAVFLAELKIGKLLLRSFGSRCLLLPLFFNAAIGCGATQQEVQ